MDARPGEAWSRGEWEAMRDKAPNFMQELRARVSSKRLTRLALALVVAVASLSMVDWRLVAVWITVTVAAAVGHATIGARQPRTEVWFVVLGNVNWAWLCVALWTSESGPGQSFALIVLLTSIMTSILRSSMLSARIKPWRVLPQFLALLCLPYVANGFGAYAVVISVATMLFFGALVTTLREFEGMRQRAMEQTQSRLLAEAESRQKTQFVATMSHELRTPLNAILGFTGILAEDAQDRGDQASERDLAKVEGAARHLLDLVERVLDLSNLESGAVEVQIEPVSVQAVIDAAVAQARAQVGDNGNALEVSIGAGATYVVADGDRLSQCLTHLLSNAFAFTQQGYISLRVERGSNDKVRFVVEDSGIGMSNDEIGRLFEPFVQLDASKTRARDGMGLGLVLTRRLMGLMGGEVELIRSTPGRGSSFALTIAAAEPNADVQDEAA